MAVKSNPAERLLVLKGNVFWYRQAKPKAVRKIIGGPQFLMVSLRTSDIVEAKRVRDVLAALTLVQFREIEVGTRFALDLGKWAETPMGAKLPPNKRGEIVREALEAAKAAGNSEEHLLILDAAEAEAHGLKAVHRKTFEDALRGRVEVSRYLDLYLDTVNLAPKTKSERRGLVGRFGVWCSENGKTLDQVERRLAGRYMTEVLDKMDPATLRKHLTAIGQYWKFLARRGHIVLPTGVSITSGWPWNDQKIEQNGKRIERGGKKIRERPFTDIEVTTLLKSPFPLKATWEALMKDALKVSLLSGMRQAEVLTLWAEEVIAEDGVLFFDIQQGKTEAAARRVPVHSALTELIQTRLKSKGPKDLLFHELRGLPDGPDTFGKRFRRWRECCGIADMRDGKRRSLVNFHSARRWFVDKARHAEISRETIGDIVGHRGDKTDITFRVYSTGASSKQRKDCVEAVKLPS